MDDFWLSRAGHAMDEIVLFDHSRSEEPVVAFQGVRLSHARATIMEQADTAECAVFLSASGRVIVAFRTLATDEPLVGFEDYPAEWAMVRECDSRHSAEVWGASQSPYASLFWRAWRAAWRRWPVQ